MKLNNLSRRDFIKLFTNTLLGLSSLIGLGGLIRYLSYQSDPGPATEFDLGPVSAFPLGSHTLRAEIPAVIYNRNGEFRALSLKCTHLGCTVEDKETEFACPCHGSRFDTDGNVLAGPAQTALKQLRVEITPENTLKIYTR